MKSYFYQIYKIIFLLLLMVDFITKILIKNSKNKKLNRYVSGKTWNKLISNKETLVIDARKPFEHGAVSYTHLTLPTSDLV